MMTSLEKAVQTQIVNIQKKTGMTLKELFEGHESEKSSAAS